MKAASMLVAARFREDAVAHPVEFNPVNLGGGINTVNDEYVNALELAGTELLFTRRYPVEGSSIQQEGLFLAHAADAQWYPAMPLHVHPDIDDKMGAAFLSYKGDALLFTVCGMDRHNPGCDLYQAFRDSYDGPWHSPQNMGERVNDPAWCKRFGPALFIFLSLLFLGMKMTFNDLLDLDCTHGAETPFIG